jgi:uncharacterized protein YjbJ (UPF0337 family)
MLRGKVREIRGGLKREWGKLTHNERVRMEGELDRMVGLFQKRYGYTQMRAVKALEHYVHDYGERTKEILGEQWKGLRKNPTRGHTWLWIFMAILGVVLFLVRVRRRNNSEHKTPKKTS